MRFPLLFTALVCLPTFAQSPTLAEIEIVRPDTFALPLDDELHLEVHVTDAESLLTYINDYRGMQGVRIDGERALVSIARDATLRSAYTAAHLAESFVMDISESSTRAFIADFTDNREGPVTPADIEAYVNGFIEDPTSIHGFQIASKVAADRSGDCTEYAVLTTALARALGIPARLVFGTVIVQDQGAVTAFGHAWSEIHYRGQWQRIDAALHPLATSSRFYVPTAELSNEGPGFAFAMFSSINTLPGKLVVMDQPSHNNP
ncbi:MAG: transglutaminase-like domain-containing protein [Pseudomonadota bacterium]